MTYLVIGESRVKNTATKGMKMNEELTHRIPEYQTTYSPQNPQINTTSQAERRVEELRDWFVCCTSRKRSSEIRLNKKQRILLVIRTHTHTQTHTHIHTHAHVSSPLPPPTKLGKIFL
jgi:hypothetical protein